MIQSRQLQQFAKTYQQDALEAKVLGAGTVDLIVQFYEGAIAAIRLAQQGIEAAQFEQKTRQINKAYEIVDCLDRVLDLERGGEVAQNLNGLYDYIKRRLMSANADNDVEALAEAIKLLAELNEGWKGLAQKVRQAAPQTGGILQA